MKSLDRLTRFLWAAALVSLPVTSFRWFPFLGDTTYVRPLALYPLALLFPLLLLQTLRRQRSFPWTGSLILLFVFGAAVLTVTSLGVRLDPLPLRGQTYLGRALRAAVTLFIGLIFFLSAAWMNRDEDETRFTLRWLLVGLGLDLAWSALQAFTFYTGLLPKSMVTHWQLAFSMRELVRINRVSGMAYEPAWLAGQLATIYLPVLFAALLTKKRITAAPWLDSVLLALATLTLLATYSRGGLLITVFAATLTLLLLGRPLLVAAWHWFWRGLRQGAAAWLLRMTLIGLVLASLAGAALFLSQKNYFRRLWEAPAETWSQYLINISAGARGAYVLGALSAFEAHPISGVGLGASGFWIYDHLPDWALTIEPEVAKHLSPQSQLFPNPKNLYVRLLAESGLIGFVLFVLFYFSFLADALTLLQRGGFSRLLGVAGFFAWLAIALYNVTEDSFATPNLWIIPGILAGLMASQAALPNEEIE
ncbi:MAG: O-antigen ligase family protein [Anaerolineae bacterium]